MKLLRLTLLILIIEVGFSSAAAASFVGEIAVSVSDLSAGASPLVLERMAKSMRIVAQEILVGQSTAYLRQNKASYETVLREVGNRAFTGYNVEKVTLGLGSETTISFQVRPWGTVTRAVKVRIQLSGVDAVWADLIREDLGDLAVQVENILTGVAADAVDWAGILARDLVRETVAARLGDFSATVDIAAGEPVAADIILIPFGSSVQGVNYQLRSNTLPSLMLVGARARLGEWAGRLRGLPVSFLARRIDKVRAVLEEKTAAERIVKTYKLSGKVDIQAKNDADVIITLDSPEYRFWIEGYLDIARHDSTAAGRAHLGRLISSKDEIFLEVTLYTDIMKWNFDPGLSRRWGKTTLSFLYRMPGEEDVWRLSYDFSPKWRLQLEKTGEFSRTEAALRYRIHEFLALEFVLGSDKENYLRLIGNL